MAARIKALIRRAGLTSQVVAERLVHPDGAGGPKITKQRFSDMINGRRPAELARFSPQIAEIIGTTQEEVLNSGSAVELPN